MSKMYAVPERVTAGSPSAIPDMHAWRTQWLAAQNNPDAFWLNITKERVAWDTLPSEGCKGDFHSVVEEPLTWFADGTLNVTVSCIDRHLATRGDKVAILWEGDEPGDVRKLTYRELHRDVCHEREVDCPVDDEDGVKRRKDLGERLVVGSGGDGDGGEKHET